jgi:hypothetical protein
MFSTGTKFAGHSIRQHERPRAFHPTRMSVSADSGEHSADRFRVFWLIFLNFIASYVHLRRDRASYANQADKLSQFFNKNAYVANNPGQYGNSGRNPLSGPGLQNVNLSLVRSFPIGESYGRIQFRSEFFNALNHANFGQPDGNFNNFSTSFAKITTASDPRILQFALRYQF